MRRGATQGTGRWIWLWMAFVLLFAVSAWASQRRCPVCNQMFDSHVEVCPNDGTDLKLIGEEVEHSVDTDNGGEEQPSDKVEEEPVTKEKETENGVKYNGKYIRQDRGGRRRRVAPQDDEDSGQSGRSDRQRRLRDERTGAVQVKRREAPVDLAAQEEARLRNLYREKKEKAIQDALRAKKPEEASDPELERQKALWKQTAPYMSIGGRFSWMGEADKPGLVLGTEIDLNLLRTNVRVGLSSFIGVRHVSRNELIFLESVSIGIQKPWRFSPFLSGRIGIGTIVSQRFGEDITNLVRAVGLDAGIDCRLNNAFVVTPSIGYVRYGIQDATWDSVTLKISLGF